MSRYEQHVNRCETLQSYLCKVQRDGKAKKKWDVFGGIEPWLYRQVESKETCPHVNALGTCVYS